MLLLLACAGPPDDSVPPVETDWGCSATSLVYEDIGPAWGLVDTTDTEPFPNEGSGVTVADLDEDGLDDVVLAVRTDTAVVHWNRGDHFEIERLEVGLKGNHAAAVDVDGDRHLDLLVSGANSFGLGGMVLLRGDGAGGFGAAEADMPQPMGALLSLDAADIDRDGDLDLYLATTGSDDLLVNDGTGHFTSIAADLDLDTWTWRSWIGIFGDYDGDGWQDLFVGNDLQAENFASRLYHNDEGTFREAGAPRTVNAMGGSPIDHDNDGDIDLFVTATALDGLYENGEGWIDVSLATGAAGSNDLGRMHLGSAAVDLDNDGWTDLVTVGGRVAVDQALLDAQDAVEPDTLLRNEGGTFRDVSGEVGYGDDGDGHGVAAGDLDGDGTWEVVVGELGRPSHVYRSECLARRSLDVELVGPDHNPYGLGARVEAHTSAGVVRGWVGTLQGEVGNGPPRAHLGLGDATLERVTVYWPGGEVQEVEVATPGRLRVEAG